MNILLTTLSLIKDNTHYSRSNYERVIYRLPEYSRFESAESEPAGLETSYHENGSVSGKYGEHTEKGSIQYAVGYYTNEAPSRYLVRKVIEELHEPFDKVIVLSTNECSDKLHFDLQNSNNDKSDDYITMQVKKAVQEVNAAKSFNIPDDSDLEILVRTEIENRFKNSEGKSTEECFKKDIRFHLEETYKELLNGSTDDLPGDDDLFAFINTDIHDYREVNRIIQEMTRPSELKEHDASKEKSEKFSVNLYVDFSGGSRVQSMLAMLLVRWLEVFYYTVVHVVYANRNVRSGRENINTIDDVTNIYQLINAVIANDKEHDYGYDDVRKRALRQISVAYDLQKYTPELLARDTIQKIDFHKIYNKKQPFIFFSYAHADARAASAMLSTLQDSGFNVWYDRQIKTGKAWEKQIRNKIESCSIAVIYLSRQYLFDSNYCAHEVNLIFEHFKKKKERKRRIYVIKADNVNPDDFPAAFDSLKKHIKKIQYLNYTPLRYEEFYNKLIRELKSRM